MLLFSMMVIFSHAQRPEALFLEALQGNTALKAEQLNYQAALAKAPQQSQLPDPEIGLGGFLLPVETRLGAQQMRLSASQMFPWPGTLASKEAWALAQAEVKKEEVNALHLELLYQIKKAWYKLYEIRKSYQIIEQNLDLLQSLNKLVESKVAAGKASLAEVLRVEMKIQELNQELKILKAEERKPLIEINQLLHRPLDTEVLMPNEMPFATLDFPKDSLARQIEQVHPRIQMLRAQQLVSQKALAINENMGKPAVGLGVDYLMVSPRTDADPLNNGQDIIQLKASLNLPIFRQKYQAKEQEESYRMQALESQKEETTSLFLSMIEKAYASYQSAALMQELYQKQMQNLQATIRLREAEYRNSNAYFDELLRIEGEYIDYELKLLRAIVMSHMARVEIERFLAIK